jgi:hypothetical protein
MREHAYTYESPEYVQFFLDQLEPMQPFVVIFQKQDGTQRKLTGTLDPNVTTRKESVPIMTDEGWKRFSVHRVLYIGSE